MYADKGSIVVVSHNASKPQTKRLSVPLLEERLEALASYGLGKAGSEYGGERDAYRLTSSLVQAVMQVLRDAKAQGDVTDPRVLRELCNEYVHTPKYTMKAKVFS